MQSGDMPIIDRDESDVNPHHHQIMNELRAIRAQMASHHRGPAADQEQTPSAQDITAAQQLLGSYRAQIEQCEKLKVELDLIHDAITRTKQEIAVLHGNSFSGDEMAKVTGELGAVVGGTEEATQQILEAAEAIDQAASALGKPMSQDQQHQLSEEIQDRVVSIFEACNFQDITGQRITKVVRAVQHIDQKISLLAKLCGMDLSGPEAGDKADGQAKSDSDLLNGPQIAAAAQSQDEIDRLFNS